MTPEAVSIIVSTVMLGPSDDPNARAMVTFANAPTHYQSDAREYQMEWDYVPIGITFNFNIDVAGTDQIIVTPPVGWSCVPVDCQLSLLDGYNGVIYLYEWKGM